MIRGSRLCHSSLRRDINAVLSDAFLGGKYQHCQMSKVALASAPTAATDRQLT